MIFVDINTFFADRAGGIRTYHAAKLEWFARQRRHHYHLVCPGPRHAVRELGPNVSIIEVYGPSLGRGPGGYRLMLDYPRVLSILRELDPDVVEAGDPWLTGLFCLGLARPLAPRPVVSAFYHSDPIRTWVEPWGAGPGRLRPARKVAAAAASRLFYALQRRYRMTMVSSPCLESHLRSRGVGRVACVPFGTDARFGRAAGRAASADGGRRLLYAGRLGREKGADLLLHALPRLLADPRMHLTVMGRGEMEDDFAAFAHPRYRFAGFVGDRGEVARAFAAHDVLLAPGPHETFGLCVLEALAAGMAVVGPDAGGTADRLRALDDPFLFRAGDGDDFVRAAFRAAAADPVEVARQAARAAAAYPSWDAAIGRMVEVYASVAAGDMERSAEAVLTHA